MTIPSVEPAGTGSPAAVVSVNNEVAVVEFATPGRANALNPRLREALTAALTEVATRRPTPRVVVLTSPGPTFCSGADLVEQPASAAWTWEDRWHEHEQWRRLLRGLRELPAITLASVQGPAVGGGVLLALACDVRVASVNASVQLPEVRAGLNLPWEGPALLSNVIGADAAKELLFTGRRMDSLEARHRGIFHRVVPAAELKGAVEELSASLTAVSPRVVRLTKASFATSATMTGWYESDATASLVDHLGSQPNGPRAGGGE